MAMHPKAQKQAQAELDAVVGPGRMPDFGDWKSLVYVDALIKEVLRWHTVAPLGVAHSTTADDELDGYFIPAGTVLLPNIWSACSASLPIDLGEHCTDEMATRIVLCCRACMHDPALYEDPDVFRPERFIRDGKLDPSVQDPLAFVFGFGRRFVSTPVPLSCSGGHKTTTVRGQGTHMVDHRICPGRHYAEAALFINVASILHTFDITPPLDAGGRPIALDHRMTPGFISYVAF